MRVLLVYPNVETRNGPHYPHGLGSLAGVLAEAGHEPVIRLFEHPPQRQSWLAELESIQPDLVACSFGSHQWPFARDLMAWSRQAGWPILAGGVHATFAPREVLAEGVCDWVCIGEGEGAILDLAQGRDPRTIANLIAPDFANPPRPLIGNLNRLPLYDRRHFPMEKVGRVNAFEMTALVGRGCPFPCTYCCNAAWQGLYHGQTWVRLRACENLFSELQLLAAKYKVDSFYFEDDIFTLDRSFFENFLREYPRQFNVPFRAYLRIGMVDRDDLRRLKDAGLTMANVGVEHGDERMRREVLDRRMTDAQIEQFFTWCRELNIRTHAFHIVGIPEETPETLRATVDLCRKTMPDEVQISLFEPYPGTALFARCVREKLIRGIRRSTYFEAQPALNLPNFPHAELARAYQAFMDQACAIENEALELALKTRTKGDFDLVAEWSNDKVAMQGAEPVARRRVRIGRDERFVLFAHPRSEIHYSIPAGRYRFRAGLALDPVCLEWGGGGVRFGVQAGETLILDRVIDPKHNSADLGWQEIDAPFSLSQPARLRLTTQPAGNDDLRALWALWGHPHLVREANR